jgi:hypothetical protein
MKKEGDVPIGDVQHKGTSLVNFVNFVSGDEYRLCEGILPTVKSKKIPGLDANGFFIQISLLTVLLFV